MLHVLHLSALAKSVTVSSWIEAGRVSLGTYLGMLGSSGLQLELLYGAAATTDSSMTPAPFGTELMALRSPWQNYMKIA
jgi:hypothetical protein